MLIEVLPPKLPDVSGIGVWMGDTVTVDYYENEIEKSVNGKIENYYVLEEKKMFTVKDDIGISHSFCTEDVEMYLEEFKRDYRFN